jgi:hypothetical protein
VAMGTWGAKAFQNDSAADWLAELEAGGISIVVPEDMTLATRAVKRVVSGESELRALWDESRPASPWHADVRTLLERRAGEADAVTGIAPAPMRDNHLDQGR